MGGKTDKAPNPFPIGPKDQTDALQRDGRSIFGERSMINNVGFEDISNLTADQIPLPTTDVAMEIISTSSDDTILGPGARSVTVTALDVNFVENVIEMNLDGTTQRDLDVLSGSGVRRINTFAVTAVGTSRGAAIGTIMIRNKATPSIIYSQINPGENTSAQSLRTVPANTTVAISGWRASTWTVAKTMKFRFQTTFNEEMDETTPGVFTTKDIMELNNAALNSPFDIPFVLPARTDMIVNAQIIQGGSASGLVSYRYFIQRS